MDVAALVSAWEATLAQPVCRRAATLLEGAGTRHAGTLDVGTRDATMLALHRELTGEILDGEATCAHCGERMDVAIPVAQLVNDTMKDGTVDRDGWHIELRVPTIDDVVWALGQPISDDALFGRCVVLAHLDDAPVPATDIPAAVRTLCEARLDAMAPLANLSVGLTCPVCAHDDDLPLDICAFVLGRAGDWAHRQLLDVAALCRAYGWNEASVLAMSSWRRAFYLARMGEP
ncbi:hypothetical protein EC912_103138 [Luteibacter rhizovicinus]|uniref:Phage baseplate protein n=1 Tax=Luteibacter rhizovicinus TaxID=242606 RepID=A0A4R3YU15_9GAMM|nr:hypothetical protein [Luteibacter rhizovicinus]TCV94653.1 hypothetical protein EC912_103138 [Luteibacter rhizovicinus]